MVIDPGAAPKRIQPSIGESPLNNTNGRAIEFSLKYMVAFTLFSIVLVGFPAVGRVGHLECGQQSFHGQVGSPDSLRILEQTLEQVIAMQDRFELESKLHGISIGLKITDANGNTG